MVTRASQSPVEGVDGKEGRVIAALKRHFRWTGLIIDASKQRNPVRALADKLLRVKDRIPISFLRFLDTNKSQPHDGQSHISGLYCSLLLQFQGFESSPEAIDLAQFLPATDIAQKKGEAMGQLHDWMERTIRKEPDSAVARSLQARFDALRDRLTSASLTTFPECMGDAAEDDAILGSAVDAFMSKAHSCYLFDYFARELLRAPQQADRDPLRVPAMALEKAREMLEGVFAGTITYDKARMPDRDFAASREETEREAHAIRSLLKRPPPAAQATATCQNDPVLIYLRLVQLDPLALVRWVGELRWFVVSILSVESVPVVEQFLARYSRDIRQLQLFSRQIDPSTSSFEANFDDCSSSMRSSVHHMLHLFENKIVQGVAQAAWPLIDELRETCSLLDVLRSRVRSVQDLKSKMDALRVMCVSTRQLARPVDILDGISLHLFNLLHCDRTEGEVLHHIRELLKSAAMTKAAAEGISISGLAHLFSYVAESESIARQNAQLLGTADIVVDLDLLVRIARNNLAIRPCLDSISIELSQTNTSAFRLTGCRAEKRVCGVETEALFVETLIQLTVLSNSETKDHCDELQKTVETAKTRVERVIELVEQLYRLARVGWTWQTSIDRSRIEFPCKTPEEIRPERLWDKSARVYRPAFDIENMIRKFSSEDLIQKYSKARERFPFISFCPPLFVMERSDCKWLKILAKIATQVSQDQVFSVNSPLIGETNDIENWLYQRVLCARRAISPSRASGTGRIPMKLQFTCVACCLESAQHSNRDNLIRRSLALLALFEELPARATAMFPCDTSATYFAISDLAWRLQRASELLEDDSNCSENLVSQIFLCQGLLIIRPDTLDCNLQDIILSALGRYSRAAENSKLKCPKIALLLPTSPQTRFSELLKTIPHVHFLTDSELEKLDNLGQTVTHKADATTVILTKVNDSARGLRPSLVPDAAFRIRIGGDTTVASIVLALKSQNAQEKPLALDFGSNVFEACNGPLAGALMSLIICGTIGQAQSEAEVVLNSIFLECAAASREDAVKRIPVLSILPADRFKVSNYEALPDYVDELHPSFQKLCEKASQGSVTDSDVEEALRNLYDAKGEKMLQPRLQTPFIHTSLSLKVMGLVASRVKHQLRVKTDSGELVGVFPVLLSGDTGTGKTYLLFKFLELLRSSGAVPTLEETVNIFTISAAFQRQQVCSLGKRIRDRVRNAQGHATTRSVNRVCAFILDEITGSSAQEVLGRLLCYNEISDGESCQVKLQHSSYILLATCNPNPDRDSVFPLTGELDVACIEVPPLSAADSEEFTLAQLRDSVRGPGLKDVPSKRALRLIQASRSCIESSVAPIGAFSLRDSVRCATLAKRLCAPSWLESGETFFDVLGAPSEGWCIKDNVDMAIALACYICYGMRVLPRASYFSEVSRCCSRIEEFIRQIKISLLTHFTFPRFVVMTPALQDNLLASVIAISDRRPLLCLGCGGTSKTLSINLLLSQMYGRFSKSKLLKCLPKAQAFNIQLSEQSTADHILKLKKTVLSWESNLSIPVIFMEELSMADMGPSGPLRALHDLLDSHQESQRTRAVENLGTGSNTFGFLATSNYGPRPNELPVGRALGNRLLILAHDCLPADSLIELGVSVGIQSVLDKDSDSHEDLAIMMRGMLKSLWTTEPNLEPLVPNLISIRSLLFFSRALAMALSVSLPDVEAQVRSFAAHLQKVTSEQTEVLWRRLGRAFRWRKEEVLRPSICCIVEDCFGQCRTRRPLLFLYENPADIFRVVSITTRVYRRVFVPEDDPSAGAVELKKICPTMRRLRQSKDAKRNTVIDGAEAMHALIQLRSAVEKGGLITILNPEPIIEGIHALLNDSAAEHSTLQLRQSHENVHIHKTTQLVLLVERTAALGLHKALLSRVSIVNSGIFHWTDSDCIEENGYQSAHLRLMQLYKNMPEELSETWIKDESSLLKECEDPLDDLIKSLLPGTSASEVSQASGSGRLFVILVGGRIPVTILQDKRIYSIDVMKSETPTQFYSSVAMAMERLDCKEPVANPMLLIDLTAATSVAAVECLTLLGLAGIRFSSAACPDALSERLLKFAARSDRRVVIAMHVSRASSCQPANFRAWSPKEGTGKPPKVCNLVNIVEVREMSRSYRDWPSLCELAIEPSRLWKLSLMAVVEHLTSAIGDGTPNGANLELRRQVADIALRYCLPENIYAAAFCPSPNIDLGESELSQKQQQLQRIRRSQDILKCVISADSRNAFMSLRTGLIEACRQLCYRAAAVLLQRAPRSFIENPTEDTVSFVRRILASRTFYWQNQVRSANAHSFEHHALYAHVSSLPGSQHQSAATRGFPFLSDLLNVVSVKLKEDIRVMSTPETVRSLLLHAFPTLRSGLQLRALGQPVAIALVNDLVRRNGPKYVGPYLETAAKWLVTVSQGTLDGLLHAFHNSERWLVVATFLQPANDSCPPAPSDWTSLEGFAVDAAHASLNTAVTTVTWRAELSPQFLRALQLAMATGAKKAGVDGRARMQQILLLWALQEKLANPNSSPLTSANRASEAQMLKVVCDILDGEPAIDELVGQQLQPERALLIRCALDECDAIAPLAIPTIAAAASKLGLLHGRSLLASAASRQNGNLAAIRYIYDYLCAALRGTLPADAAGSRTETVLAAGAVRMLCERRSISAMDAARLLERLPRPPAVAISVWESMCLSVGAFVLPNDAFLDALLACATTAEDGATGSEGGGRRPIRRLAALLFDSELSSAAAEPLQNLLVRCLVARLDEGGLPILARGLPHIVGQWIAPFLVRSADGPMCGLSILPGFDTALDNQPPEEEGWSTALQDALLATAVTASSQPARSSGGWQHRVLAAVEDEALSFCRLPAAAWCFVLRLLAPASILASENYCSEAGISRLYLAGAPEGSVEMMRRLGAHLGVTSVNRCFCGFVYGIGDCGRPMEQVTCPGCRRQIGGTHHEWAAGVNQGVANGDDAVQGLPLTWFFEGTGYTERDLLPIEYRVLSVLLLLPLSVFSRQAVTRRVQLRRHWDMLKSVAGLTSDTDAQHFLLSLLARSLAQGAGALQGLALGGYTFQTVNDRSPAEIAFARAVRGLLGGASPRSIVAEAQASLARSEQSKPLMALRDAQIESLNPNVAARRFAPQVLHPKPGVGFVVDGCVEVLLEALRKEVVAAPDRFPVLAHSLFNRDAADSSPQLARLADAGRRLQSFPDLVAGFQLLHRRAVRLANAGSCYSEDASAALDAAATAEPDGAAAARRFRQAWEVCRYGQRVECQEVADLGDLGALSLEDLLIGEEQGGREGLSRAETLLTGLIAAHDEGVRALYEANQGEATTDTVNLWDVAAAGRIGTLLIPWRAARTWAEDVLVPALQASNLRAATAESLTRAWLLQRLGAPPVKMTLDGWPRTGSTRTGMVRVTAAGQADAIPADARAALNEWVLRFGLLRDSITIALELVQRIAARIEFAGRAVSPETTLVELFRDLLQQPQRQGQANAGTQGSGHVQVAGVAAAAASALGIPSPLKEMLSAMPGRQQLRVRHLNALLTELASRIDVRPEEALTAAYRVELPAPAAATLDSAAEAATVCASARAGRAAAASAAAAAAARRRLATLLKRLMGLAERAVRDGFPAAQDMGPYLEAIDDSDVEDGEEGWSALVVGLRLEHLYHTLARVRLAMDACGRGEGV